jgi:putative spermidine/putrescine transport system substrate-binding protein
MQVSKIASTFLVAAAFGLIAGSAHAQYQGQTLNVASFGGAVDKAFQKAVDGFEQKFGVTIRWVPGNTAENAAKVVATKGRPEYDVAMLDDVAQEGVSRLGLLAKLDPAIITNYADLRPQAKFPSNDGLPIGFNFTGLFYNQAEFQKRNWAPPKSWNDVFRPEFCNNIGFLSPAVSYTLNFLVLLAGGDTNKVPESIARLSKLKGCIRTLEPSSAKLEEKIQLGEYLVGIHGSVRILPLGVAGYPVKFIIPDEGTALSSTTVAAVIGGKEKLAQEFINWIISPKAQQVLMEEAFFIPSNSKVSIPPKFAELGMPGPEILAKAIKIDGNVIADRRREWSRQIERELTP